uniref:F-box domain-containing protein n=1 Tax=Setaria italica TaxID=4555 RepID=K3ZZ92_SETIT
MGEGRRRRCRHGQTAAMDCISGLPDELLHDILLRLDSARAAARTSVLSRRWRYVWAHLPELVSDGNGTDSDSAAPPASFLDSVDGALRAYSAPAIEALDISVPGPRCPAIPARRVGSWLRFASRRRGAQEITLSLGDRWRLGFRPAGVFMALTDLEIRGATMEGRVLEALVCSQCPRLIDLNLVVTLAAKSDVSLRYDSLEALCFNVENTRRVEIVAPRMEELSVPYSDAVEARISAPKLAELEIVAYESFVNDANKLPKCGTLFVTLNGNCHGFAASMLHLLRKCNSVRNFIVQHISCVEFSMK